MSKRYAVYFIGPKDSELAQFGASVLGYDLHSESLRPRLPLQTLSEANLVDLTERASVYGFHATMKAPFRLKVGETEGSLLRAFENFCLLRRAVRLPELRVSDLRSFLALCPVYQPVELLELETAVVRAFNQFRAPLNDIEIRKWRPKSLSAAQTQNLQDWGYPFVGSEFRFHMTLTGLISDDTLRLAVKNELGLRIQEMEHRDLGSLALVFQESVDQPFRILKTAVLEG